jgi:hypothetical protein
MPLAKGGVNPFGRYVIREKGKIELGGVSCGVCHTRVMLGGTVIKGAQSNMPADWMFGLCAALGSCDLRERTGGHVRRLEWLRYQVHAAI